MTKAEKEKILYLTIEALKYLMCYTKLISCRSVTIEYDAHVSINTLNGVTYSNYDNVVAIVDYGRDLEGEDWVLCAATLAIHINNILENDGVDPAYYIKVMPNDELGNKFERQGSDGKLYCFKCKIYCGGGGRTEFIKSMYKLLK